MYICSDPETRSSHRGLFLTEQTCLSIMKSQRILQPLNMDEEVILEEYKDLKVFEKIYKEVEHGGILGIPEDDILVSFYVY